MYKFFEINEKGHNIRCKLYYNDLSFAQKAIICIHGFSGHKNNRSTERFSEKVLSKFKNTILISFDLPCHGDDVKKKLRLSDCDTYLELVIEYVKSHYEIDEIYAYANSFGGYLVMRYITLHGNPFTKIALRSPALNMYESMTGTLMNADDRKKLEKGKDVSVGFDKKISVSCQFLDELKAGDIMKHDFLDYAEDIIIIHGTSDEIVPFEISKDFSDNNLIELVAVEGADHRYQNPLKMDMATKKVLEFFGF